MFYILIISYDGQLITLIDPLTVMKVSQTLQFIL